MRDAPSLNFIGILSVLKISLIPGVLLIFGECCNIMLLKNMENVQNSSNISDHDYVTTLLGLSSSFNVSLLIRELPKLLLIVSLGYLILKNHRIRWDWTSKVLFTIMLMTIIGCVVSPTLMLLNLS